MLSEFAQILKYSIRKLHLSDGYIAGFPATFHEENKTIGSVSWIHGVKTFDPQ